MEASTPAAALTVQSMSSVTSLVITPLVMATAVAPRVSWLL